jgi:PAS domain S-box-containing protein
MNERPEAATEPGPLEAQPGDDHDRRYAAEEMRRLNAELSQQALHLREVNQTLLDSERRLRLAIATGRIGLWVWNSTDLHNVGDWSQQMKEIFGLPLDADVTHDMFLKCVHPDDRARVDRAVMQSLAGENGGEYHVEYRTIHQRDGSTRWVTARGQAFFSPDGHAVRFIGTVMDITERKRAEEAAVMEERNRMARDLHDTLAQGFTGVIVQLEAAEDAWSKGLSAEAGEHLARARELARESLQEARLAARALRSQALAEKDLCEAMEDLIKKMTVGTGVVGAFTREGKPWPLSNEWEENLLRIGQEVLTNTLRHARARHFNAHLAFDPQELRFELRDDGAGFDPDSLHEGLGLIGIKERVEAMGGKLSIQSARGSGTIVFASLPAPSQKSDKNP